MSATIYARTYQTVATDAADPRETLVLLFEGAVRFLHQAREAMVRKDYEGQSQGIIRTQRIISTLMTSLDATHAPELTQGLCTAYAWMHGSLTEANIRDDLELLDAVLECVEKMHRAWVQARQSLVEEEQSGLHRSAA
jgi:flagellar secretion chaperone FliS